MTSLVSEFASESRTHICEGNNEDNIGQLRKISSLIRNTRVAQPEMITSNRGQKKNWYQPRSLFKVSNLANCEASQQVGSNLTKFPGVCEALQRDKIKTHPSRKCGPLEQPESWHVRKPTTYHASGRERKEWCGEKECGTAPIVHPSKRKDHDMKGA